MYVANPHFASVLVYICGFRINDVILDTMTLILAVCVVCLVFESYHAQIYFYRSITACRASIHYFRQLVTQFILFSNNLRQAKCLEL